MKLRIILACSFAVILLSGCGGGGKKDSPVVKDLSGFLTNYQALRAGQEGEPTMIYRAPEVQLFRYKKVYIEPIRVWRGTESQSGGTRSEDVQVMADYLYTAVYQELSKDYEMVSDPDGLGVLHVRIAYSKVLEQETSMDVVSTDTPNFRLLNDFTSSVQGAPVTVGKGVLEAEIQDATRGELLWAGVESDTDDLTQRMANLDWGDVQTDLNFLAARFRWRLCTERGDSNCQMPPLPEWRQ